MHLACLLDTKDTGERSWLDLAQVPPNDLGLQYVSFWRMMVSLLSLLVAGIFLDVIHHWDESSCETATYRDYRGASGDAELRGMSYIQWPI